MLTTREHIAIDLIPAELWSVADIRECARFRDCAVKETNHVVHEMVLKMLTGFT